MTTHPPLRKESANGFIPSCLSPRFPWPLVLLTRAPQALPTAADRRILICASTPGSYSPGFWGRGVGDTPSCACAARPGPWPGDSALDGRPGGWAALRPGSTQGFPLRSRGLAKGQCDISALRSEDARDERDPLCVSPLLLQLLPPGPVFRQPHLALSARELPLRSPQCLAEKPGGASPAHAQSKEPEWTGNISFL